MSKPSSGGKEKRIRGVYLREYPVFVVVGGYSGRGDSVSGEGRITKSYRKGDKATMVQGGGNKAGRFLKVSVLAEGGRKGVIWLPEGRYGKGWRRFVGELRQLVAAQFKLSSSAECGAPPSTGFLMEASSSGVIAERSFVEAIRSTSGVEVRAVVFKGCSSRSLDLFPVSSCFESRSNGVGLRSAMDCSALDSVPRYMAAAAGSVSMKKKGKFSIFRLLRPLGQFHLKLDRVLAGFAMKPIRRRKRVRFLGFRKFVLGWVSRSVLEAGSGQNLEPNLELGSDLCLKPGLDLGLNLDPSSVFPLVSKVVLSPKVSGLILPLEIVRNSS